MYQLHEVIHTLRRQCPLNALLIDRHLVNACAIQWLVSSRRFINGMEDHLDLSPVHVRYHGRRNWNGIHPDT
jgi:hypothetical protein